MKGKRKMEQERGAGVTKEEETCEFEHKALNVSLLAKTAEACAFSVTKLPG